MTIWVDADSCPGPVRAVISRAAARTGVPAVYVANRPIPFPPADSARMEVVSAQEGSADDWICLNARPGDLCITRDIPLAARLIELEIAVINDRGTRYDRNNIGPRLSERNMMKEFRERGLMPEKQGSYSAKELQTFANQFDRTLTRLLKGK